MAFLVVQQKVQDYSVWKKVFVARASARRAAGSKGGRIYHTRGNPCEVMVVCEWDTIEKARAFTQAGERADIWEEAGVIGTSEILFLDDRETFPF